MPRLATTESLRAGARRRRLAAASRRPAIAACLLLALVACGGGSDDGATPTGPASWLAFQDAVAYPSAGRGVTSLVARDGLLDVPLASATDHQGRVLRNRGKGTR